MEKVNSIYDLVKFPTKFTYEPKDVILIIGDREQPLLNEQGEARFTEEQLTPAIEKGMLWYKKRGD